MTKFKSFISWFPKIFEKTTHEENLKEISYSMSNTLTTSKMKGEFLTASEIDFVLKQFKKDLKTMMEIRLSSEKLYIDAVENNLEESKEKCKQIKELIKSL